MSVFEVVIYNKDVREKVEAGGRHAHLDSSWADSHHEQVRADNADAACAKIARRFPESQEFVIVDVFDTEF